MNYEQFIKMLSSLTSTEQILITLFNYFKNNVSYNYDELQVVKYQRYENEYLRQISNLITKKKNEKSDEFKEYLIKLLDDAFLKIEGRPLSEKNKLEWFKNYGTVIHHEAQPAKNGIIKIPARDAYDEIVHIESNNYPPIYCNGLLKDGVCAEYSKWVKQICDSLNIPCLKVRGKGTTGHAWNLIYVQEKNMWVNFDMTMVRFYIDGWSKEYGEPEKWIFATNDEMFKLQPQRIIEQILGDDDTILFTSVINANNQEELNEFLNGLYSTEKMKK